MKSGIDLSWKILQAAKKDLGANAIDPAQEKLIKAMVVGPGRATWQLLPLQAPDKRRPLECRGRLRSPELALGRRLDG